jgi:Putative restriction endonuclease
MAVHQSSARWSAKTNTGGDDGAGPFTHWPLPVGRVEKRHGLTFVYSLEPGGFRIGDYLKVPDKNRIELWDGIMVVYPPADKRTLALTKYFYELLAHLCQVALDPYIGPLDVPIGRATVFAPDLLVLPPSGPPALVVEFRRDTTPSRNRERWAKLAGYARAGVKNYWAVDPSTLTLTAHERTERGTRWIQPEANPPARDSGLPVRVPGMVRGQRVKVEEDPRILRRVLEGLMRLR